MKDEKDLNYYKNNCENDYLNTPISVLKYITELEEYIKLNKDKERKFNIDFNGSLLAGIEINNNLPFVFGAMDGYGNGINVSNINIEEIINERS